jgi:hypothetical protein
MRLLIKTVALPLIFLCGCRAQTEIDNSSIGKTLLELINKNDEYSESIFGLEDISRINTFSAHDVELGKLTCYIVIYSKGGKGERGHSFVFNSNDQLLLESKDWLGMLNGGLIDLTGDGTIEKIVAFIDDSENELYPKTPTKLMVHDLNNDNDVILSLRYNFDRARKKLHFNPTVMFEKSSEKYYISFVSVPEEYELSFVWNSTLNSFIYNYTGGTINQYFDVTIPNETDK